MSIFGLFPRARAAQPTKGENPDRTGKGAFQEGPKPPPPPRVRLLDALRGFSVISMVAYHALFDIVYYFGLLDAPWYRGLPGYVWQQSICWVFILVAGASLHYGRHPARHGLVVLGCAVLLTAATAIMGPAMLVSFGVLHMLGCAILLFALLRPVLRRVPAGPGAAVFFLLFAFFKQLPYGWLGILDARLIPLPAGLYFTKWLAPLGLPGPGFSSSDYFPLVPWVFLLLAGYCAWGLLKSRVPPTAPGKNPLEATGRHSLPIYMAHQPLIYGVLLLAQHAFAR